MTIYNKMGLILSTVEKLCPQLGITVDEIDNLEIGVLEASTNEVPDDILTKANAVSKVPDAHDKDVNVKDESTQLKTHNVCFYFIFALHN